MARASQLGPSGFPRPPQTFVPKSFIQGDLALWNKDLQAWVLIGLNIQDLSVRASELDVLTFIPPNWGPRGVVTISGTQPAQSDGRLWLDTAATGSPGASLATTDTITSDTTLTTSHAEVFCDALAGAITVTLPPAAANAGRAYLIKKIDVSVNVVTIDGNAAETIDGATTRLLSSQHAGIEIRCDGTEWWIR